MKTLHARNAHEAVAQGLELLQLEGVRQGTEFCMAVPIATILTDPCERVSFWPESNPFLALFTGLWTALPRCWRACARPPTAKVDPKRSYAEATAAP